MTERPDKAGFTLVEVMVTISVIILLAGLLTPSVVAIREAWLRQQTGMQLGNLRMAIWSYSGEVRLGRALPPSLPPTIPPTSDSPKDVNTGQTLDKFYTTGAEALAYYMLGGAGRGFTVTWNGVQSTIKPYYPGAPEEIRASYDASIKSGGNWMGLTNAATSSASRRVFVDKYSTTYDKQQAELTRPILYWCARPGSNSNGNPYVLTDNQDIIKNVNGPYAWSESNYATTFTEKMKDKSGDYLNGILLQSPGPDRKYMTDDDIIDSAEKN